MKINNDHMYHGAALTQIAEHPQFTAINSVHLGERLSRCAFRINDNIGVYLKYATSPGPFNDYVFSFNEEAKDELGYLSNVTDNVFIALVCVKARQICCISNKEFCDWLKRRQKARGEDEKISTILVRLPDGKAFRINMNQPGRRGKYLDKSQLIPRNRFPKVLFG